jgi:two-component system, NarL family, response regulator NreC
LMRILIADDNERVRRGVRGILSSEANYRVCGEAVDGADALRKARELSPDLILLDVSMPGPDGLETARLLRREMPKVKVIIMSQHDPVQLLPRAIEAGADGCVDKSRLDADLLATIQSIESTSNAPETPAKKNR